MGIEHHYSKEVRANLQMFPVWQPGFATAPGEVGELKHGVFIRQGELKDLGVDVSVKKIPVPGEMKFQSANAFILNVNGSGTEAKIRIEFSRKGAVIFYAKEVTEARIQNLQEVRVAVENLKKSGKWVDNNVFVSSVIEAECLGVLISSGNKEWVELQGDATILQQFKIGEAGIKFGHSNSLGYMKSGCGPALLRLYGFGWWKKGVLKKYQFAASGQNAPLELGEIATNDPKLDS